MSVGDRHHRYMSSIMALAIKTQRSRNNRLAVGKVAVGTDTHGHTTHPHTAGP
jgi:hypothetical protein